MNGVDARAVPVRGGYHGQFRKVHRSDWEPVQVNGKPIVYVTSHEAEVAAWRALRAHLCGDIVGDGAKPSATRSKAEELFGAIFRKGKKIPVQRLNGRR